MEDRSQKKLEREEGKSIMTRDYPERGEKRSKKKKHKTKAYEKIVE